MDVFYGGTPVRVKGLEGRSMHNEELGHVIDQGESGLIRIKMFDPKWKGQLVFFDAENLEEASADDPKFNNMPLSPKSPKSPTSPNSWKMKKSVTICTGNSTPANRFSDGALSPKSPVSPKSPSSLRSKKAVTPSTESSTPVSRSNSGGYARSMSERSSRQIGNDPFRMFDPIPACSVGSMVEVVGLAGVSRWNGKVGKITTSPEQSDHGVVTVRFDDHRGYAAATVQFDPHHLREPLPA
eukprot:TRINITY_DN37175_c0_g1_i1.p1 TRINITY_DN37175_c0_g1~~TRINITY_DN37175_c0_g1_i1.p1  ORF type:complete len:240 (+),score=42.80 TRINITY_DN37175_c0_g1_i1:63-782(+)